MILVGLGANLSGRFGAPEEALRAAVVAIDKAGVRVDKVSNIWLSAPVPISDQPWYRNAVVLVETDLNAKTLLGVLQRIEADFGRVRGERNAPRVLDLDILTFHDEVIDDERCVVPHPRMHERAFVLEPLREIASDWVHPVSGLGVEALIEAMPAGQEIENSKLSLRA